MHDDLGSFWDMGVDPLGIRNRQAQTPMRCLFAEFDFFFLDVVSIFIDRDGME